MRDVGKYEDPLKFRPNYTWPEPGTQRSCPKSGHPLQLVENSPTYFGKPWWCSRCQYQFTEEELAAGSATCPETESVTDKADDGQL